MAVDVVGGTLGAPFEAHMLLARQAGLRQNELKAALILLAEYSIPKAWEALDALRKLSGGSRQSSHLEDPQPEGGPAPQNQKTTMSQVEVVKYDRQELSARGDSDVLLVETRLEEKFSGGMNGLGHATHLRTEHSNGAGTLICLERFEGSVETRSGSFVLRASGYTTPRRVVHGKWEVLQGSGTKELAGLRGFAVFSAEASEASKTGWSAETTLTYWLDYEQSHS